MDFIEIVEIILPISKKINANEISHHIQHGSTLTFPNSVYTKEKKPEDVIDVEIKINTDIGVKEPIVASIDDYYETFVKRTFAECYEEYKAPQRSSKWHLARKHAITASNFGAAVGNNKYCSPKQCTLEKLWSTFSGNSFTQYGTFHENDARDSFLKALSLMGPTLQEICPGMKDFVLHETGLLKHPDCPWMAVSPDGLLQLKTDTKSTWAVVEFKCPARLRDTSGHPYARQNNVPEYYMDQVQGICGLLHEYPEILKMVDTSTCNEIQDIFFVVWQPHQFHITRIKFDQDYYYTSLKPKLHDWYFKQYLPFAFLKYRDELEPNSLTVKAKID